MRITDVKVRKFFDEGNLKAIVSVTFNDCLVVHDIKIVEAKGKRFVAMPAVKCADGSYRDTAHPVNTKLREELTDIVLEQYEAQKIAKTTEV
jgi:stage V sporulation protein G